MKLITAMIVKDEVDRYLPMVLGKAKEYSDKIVVLDDHSTDNTVEYCEDHGCKVYTTQEDKSIFWEREHDLRTHLWTHILPREARTGDWILALDADEVLADHFLTYKDSMLRQEEVNTYTFQFWEAWNSPDKIRIDRTWNPIGKNSAMLTRYTPSVNYTFPMIGLHCGRIPMNSLKPIIPSGCSVLHLGWANPEEHEAKIQRYHDNDPNPHPQMQFHYDTMKMKPTLIDWYL